MYYRSFTIESVRRRFEVVSQNNTSQIVKRMVGLVEMNILKICKFFKLCENHPALDSAALFIHKTDNASLSAIHSNVAKFSNLKLSQTHLDFLNLGLSFCPTPRHINPVKVCCDNEQFCRRLQEYFSTKNHDNCSSTNNNKTKEWAPPDGINQFIDSF